MLPCAMPFSAHWTVEQAGTKKAWKFGLHKVFVWNFFDSDGMLPRTMSFQSNGTVELPITLIAIDGQITWHVIVKLSRFWSFWSLWWLVGIMLPRTMPFQTDQAGKESGAVSAFPCAADHVAIGVVDEFSSTAVVKILQMGIQFGFNFALEITF